ncbi:MAG: hypothetical protein JOZ91_04075 [Candidatus Eremiobacteraeota bacterium]|nr:hypothetical protein [Candidatus Eremiobacteraeota bacterium]
MWFLRLSVLVVACGLAMGGCGGGGGYTGTSMPTASPAPGAVLATPNPAVLSLSGLGFPKSIAQIAYNQANATGPGVITTTCISTPPAATDVLSPLSVTNQNLNGGMLTGNFGPITALNMGACQFKITPAAGTGATIPVTVNP